MHFRIKSLRLKLNELFLDGFLVFNSVNISYITEYNCRDAYLLISPKKIFYFTDGRYFEEAKKNLRGLAQIIKIKNSLLLTVIEHINSLKLKRVGFEQDFLSYREYRFFRKSLRFTKLVPLSGVIESLRKIKNQDEIKMIKHSVEIAVKTMEFAKKIIKPDLKEIEVVAELERFMRYQGAQDHAFDIIVASGGNSSFPHYVSSVRKIKDNDLVLVDLGVKYKGYCSDLTRVFFLGKIKPLIKRVYSLVKEAQSLALTKIRPGICISETEKKVRDFFRKYRLERYFLHSLGHGIGLEVHEAPRISLKNEEEFKENMVFTLEPAIYLPKRFGIRLEDVVMVNKYGCEVLSGALHK